MRKQGEKSGASLLSAGTYSTFVDGSIFDGGRQAGAGWVICDKRGRIVESGSRRIGEMARGTTTIAEIYAAAASLRAICQGSHITLHSDDQDLCLVLQNDFLAARIRRNRNKPDLQRAYKYLFNEVARHHVTAVKIHVDDSPLMLRAHHLAREGAHDKPQCALPAPPAPPPPRP